MKVLIGGAKGRLFHLKQLGDALEKRGIGYRLVHDVDVYDGFPSRTMRNWVQTRARFSKLVKEFKPNAILIDRPNNFGVAALKSNIPLFVLLRGDFWTEIMWAKETRYRSLPMKIVIWQKQRIAEQCFKGARTILPISKYLTAITKRHYPNKDIQVLYADGRNPSDWYKVSGMKLKHPCVGLLQGAWIWGKVKEMLTLPKVLEKLPNVMFYWAGDGPYRNEVLNVLGKYDNFKWLGNLQYPDKVREYLSEIDIYALFSGAEGLGQTIIEAALMEKPVIATKVGGIPEIIEDKKSGYLVEKGNYNSWVSNLSDLINNSNKAKQMAMIEKKFILDNFSWEQIANKFATILKNTLS